MPVVYGLISTRNNEIRYVGETHRDLYARFWEHFRDSKKKELQVYNWMRLERWCGYRILPVKLSDAPHDRSQRLYLQNHWINALPDLVNERSIRRYRTNLSERDRRVVSQVRNLRWRFVDNWEGWTGIRYYPEDRAWQVHVQFGLTYETLRGDDPVHIRKTYTRAFGHPGYHSDWYFGDSSRAIDARNEFREMRDRDLQQSIWRTSYPWPPDDAERQLDRLCTAARFDRPLDDQLRQFTIISNATDGYLMHR
jgi:hypothetical protein